MEEFVQYRSATLFVLVGANPLPNYVAIQCLRQPEGHVYFIHTAETELISNRICQVTGLRLGENATKILVDPTRMGQMVDTIQRHAKGKVGLGLHYTGGTKRMVVAALQTVKESATELGYQPTLSYLDAKRLHFLIEKSGWNTHILPAAMAVEPTVAELLALHGYSVNPYPTEPLANKVEGLYRDLVQTDYAAFRHWWKMAEQGQKGQMATIALPQDETLAPLAYHWHGMATLGALAERWQTTVKALTAWFGNMGLEDYTLWSLQQEPDQTGVQQSAMNLMPVELNFEFDVIALRGYQLFAISCANTHTKEKIKLKLFEAYTRARQMGGDEARVAVVCRAPAADEQGSPEVIEEEIRNAWDHEGKVRIFGVEHLPELPLHLADWLTA